jgi:hypothetical protein
MRVLTEEVSPPDNGRRPACVQTVATTPAKARSSSGTSSWGGSTWDNVRVSIDELRHRWLSLTRQDVPARAEAEQWALRADHCFQRVILDAVCEGRWYDHVTGRPAYRHLDEHRLALAVSLAQQLATDPDGRQLCERLDAQSLSWRGKSPKASAARLGRGPEERCRE